MNLEAMVESFLESQEYRPFTVAAASRYCGADKRKTETFLESLVKAGRLTLRVKKPTNPNGSPYKLYTLVRVEA